MIRSLVREASSVVWRSPLKVPEIASRICISCRTRRQRGGPIVEEHIRGIPDHWKNVSQLDNLNLAELRPQYRHIEALNVAPEQVRKVFTLKFGTDAEKYEAKYLEYGEKLQRHKHDHDSLEMKITRITIKIRKIQEEMAKMLYENKKMRIKLQSLIRMRTDSLLTLRSRNFERYCLVMKVLDLNVIFPPEFDVKLTPHAQNLAEMRLRSFAEVQRVKVEKERKSKEVAELESEILEKLKMGELVYNEDEAD